MTVSLAQESDVPWTSVVQSATRLTKIISFYTGTPAALQSVVTEVETVVKTTTFTDASHQVITYTTPVMTVTPTGTITLEIPIGTYLFYDQIYGGLNVPTNNFTGHPSYPEATDTLRGPFRLQDIGGQPTCAPDVQTFEKAMPTRAADWRSFYHSVTGALLNSNTEGPVELPSSLLKYLNSNSRLKSSFHGTNLLSCTTTAHETIPASSPEGMRPSPVPISSTFAVPISLKPSSSKTYISTTYQSSSTHIRVTGPLRSLPPKQTAKDVDIGTGPKNTDKPAQPGGADQPGEGGRPGGGQVVAIGTKTYGVRPTGPSGVVVGTVTLNPGYSTLIDNVPVVVPTVGNGHVVVVGTNSYQVLPRGSPVLSVADAILTPNQQGQYKIGTQTLVPGGPAITVNDYTLSLNSDGSFAIINGVTQTLESSPLITGAPVLTIGDQTYTAIVTDGTTAFVLGPGQTLLPGGPALTISGATYSLPSPSLIVINGITSTLGLGPLTAAPDITLAGKTYAATVRDGTTEYVLGPGTTLRPGEAVTISGTTYSLDALGTALVINGQTSTVPRSSVPATNSATPTASAEITDGAKFVQPTASSSSKGGAVSVRRAGLDIWVESCVLGVESWLLMML